MNVVHISYIPWSCHTHCMYCVQYTLLTFLLYGSFIFAEILLDFKTLKCWYRKTTGPIFMKLTELTTEGI